MTAAGSVIITSGLANDAFIISLELPRRVEANCLLVRATEM